MKLSIPKSKFTFFVQIYILIQPLLDFFTSLMTRFSDFPLTIGIIFRIAFVAFAGFYLVFLYKGPYKKTLSLSFIGICLFGAINILCNAYFYGLKNLFENTKMFFKVYYFLFVLLFFLALYIGKKFIISSKILATVFIIYSASIFLSAITNTSFVTYNYGVGYCGWFYAGNEVGAIISCLAPIALIYALNIKNIIFKLATFFLVVFSALYIGTKVPFLALIGAIGIFILFYLLKLSLKTSANSKILLQCVSLLLITAIIFNLNSPIKQNLSGMSYNNPDKISGDGNDFDSSSDLDDYTSSDSPFENDTSNDNQNSSDTNFKSELFNKINWLLSNRLIFSKPAFDAYSDASLIQKLFGMGYHFKTVDGDIFIQHIEMDFVAIFINYGIIGFIIYIAILGTLAVICIKNFFKNIKNILCMENEITYIYSILITLFAAFLAGHILVAPAVSIYLAIAIINLYSFLDRYKPHKKA